MLTVKEYSDKHGLSVNTVYSKIRSGELRSKKAEKIETKKKTVIYILED